MLIAVSEGVKKRAPALHGFVKRVICRTKLPAVKLLNGRLTLTAPNLLFASPTEPHILRWIRELLQPGDTFLDVGAHWGWMSLAACHRVGATGKVVAFEPSPPLLELLSYNKKANGFRQMEIVPKAVADSDDRVLPFHLVNQGNSFLNSLVDHRMEPSASVERRKSTVQVQTVTLDEFCKTGNLRPNVVKIDVEGAELLVLRGCKRLLGQGRTSFIVAVHPTWLPGDQKAEELFDLFQVHGYRAVLSRAARYDGADFADYVFVPERNGRAALRSPEAARTSG